MTSEQWRTWEYAQRVWSADSESHRLTLELVQKLIWADDMQSAWLTLAKKDDFSGSAFVVSCISAISDFDREPLATARDRNRWYTAIAVAAEELADVIPVDRNLDCVSHAYLLADLDALTETFDRILSAEVSKPPRARRELAHALSSAAAVSMPATSEMLHAIARHARAVANADSPIRKLNGLNARRTYFIRHLSASLVERYGGSFHSVVACAASVAFDCVVDTKLVERIVRRKKPQRRRNSPVNPPELSKRS